MLLRVLLCVLVLVLVLRQGQACWSSGGAAGGRREADRVLVLLLLPDIYTPTGAREKAIKRSTRG
jgi:hypothetical protein